MRQNFVHVSVLPQHHAYEVQPAQPSEERTRLRDQDLKLPNDFSFFRIVSSYINDKAATGRCSVREKKEREETMRVRTAQNTFYIGLIYMVFPDSFEVLPQPCDLSVVYMGVPHEQQRKFRCQFCGKGYRWKSTMRRHEMVECGGKPPAFQCPMCPYKARQRGNLTVHYKRHHQKIEMRKEKDSLGDFSKRSPVFLISVFTDARIDLRTNLGYTRAQFPLYLPLVKFEATAFAVFYTRTNRSIAIDFVWSCETISNINAVTGGMFNNISAMITIIVDQRSKFNLVAKLKEEQRNECICMPNEEKSLALFVCYWLLCPTDRNTIEVQQAISVTSSSKNRGIFQPVQTTRGQLTYKCPNCNRFYMRMSCLKRHLRVECGQAPKYQCEICQGWFKYKHNLATHMKIHVEEPKHHCGLCPKRFHRRDKLLKHQKKLHKILLTLNSSSSVSDFSGGPVRWKLAIEVTPYQCPKCFKYFKSSKSCSNHRNTCGTDKKFRCAFCDYRSHQKNNVLRHLGTQHPEASQKERVHWVLKIDEKIAFSSNVTYE
ncbi:Longitudinals lacking protein, isoform G [Melipona quadrifasciata]|uniref:Longitudinals lacking protein, isoform G n=1 Tax=Melipona quadrifasciata TaxID=166423 RepID=A0A0N0U5B0_9HYME|nr:Longitudinals lacking protein, isoform G [Melipona quadrifasciata]